MGSLWGEYQMKFNIYEIRVNNLYTDKWRNVYLPGGYISPPGWDGWYYVRVYK